MKKSDYDGKYPGNLNFYLTEGCLRCLWTISMQLHVSKFTFSKDIWDICVWWNSLCLFLFQNKHFVLIYFHMVFCNIFAFENKSLSLKLKKMHCSDNTMQKQSNILQSIAKCVKLFCSILQKSIELYKNFEMVWFSQFIQTFCEITQNFWEMMPKSCDNSIIFCKVI